jgi:hypothetical protein
LTRPITRSSSNLMWNYLFAFYILFCIALKMMGSDKIHTTSCTYVHVLSLCHLYPLQFTWRITNENFQKILFLCNSSHNFTPKRNELRYHCYLSQLHRVLASCCSRKIE